MEGDGEWNMNFEYNENMLLVLIKACEMLCEMFHTNQNQCKIARVAKCWDNEVLCEWHGVI